MQNSTVIFRNEEGMSLQEVTKYFQTKLAESSFNEEEVQDLVTTFAKYPTDGFIIYSDNGSMKNQGDIVIWGEKSNLYKQEAPKLHNLQETDRMVLQEGDSFTGDHRIIPLPNQTVKVMEGKFTPTFLEGKNSWRTPEYRGLLIESDKPFLIFHREHRNIVLPSGKYMVCTQINQKNLSIMLD